MIPADISGLREALTKLQISTLNIIGKHDQIITRESSEGVCQILPRCKDVTIDEAGHVPHEEKPEEVIRLLKDFLAEVLGLRSKRVNSDLTRGSIVGLRERSRNQPFRQHHFQS
jgi:hypothetical protein